MIIAKYKLNNYKINEGIIMSYRINFINRIVYAVVFIWTSLVSIDVLLTGYENYTYADTLAENEALVSVKKDLAYRTWVSSHGGVYVPITKRTPPNPYLSHIKNRDVNTSANQQLTLMNPAYTLSQMMKDYSELYGSKGHITSLKLINPKNKPDSWEKKALKTIDITKKPVFSKAMIDNEEYFRYLSPLVTKEACLKCHAFQGYKVGEIRGGVSVAIPLKNFYQEAFSQTLRGSIIMLFIYLLGLGVIFYGRKKAKEVLDNKIKDYEQHIFSLVKVIEKRDSYTAGHTQRVAKYSVLIAEQMGYDAEKVDDLYRACMLHDIGKISTPDSILLKPGKLTPLEYDIIKEHVTVSYELLSEVDIYGDIAEIVRHHHEHYDGSGYPQGLKGDQIPIMSQIMTVADAFDAMTTNRVYKARKDVDIALEELEFLSGKQFNSKIIKASSIALRGIKVEPSITQRAQTKIEKERFSYFYRDLVTGVYNKDYLEFILAYNHEDEFDVKCVYCIYLHNFSQYNKIHSWEEGDKLLKIFAKKLDSISPTDFVFRIYGDDFVILNKEHYEFQEYYKTELENILVGSGITLTYKHVDIKKNEIHSIEDLEKLL